ncbi:glycoside hydrolase family 76 protein [Cesiribacter sp. SM1]|uniref:glycoside hydrolase family 76 protein n=1 Tax=Cesiribacter sp. SM1 TaxID=2861196 RepID=UPI001CD2FA9C|nr:glycoside hydrolase family 76 protein [Cesiribacter sp. SM1]
MAAILLVLSINSCSGDDPKPLNDGQGGVTEVVYTWSETADSLQEATYNTYLSTNGTFRQDNAGNNFFNYWWNAHMLDVLIDGYIRTDNEQYKARMKSLLQGIKVMNGGTYHNVFNDDMEWLGMACLRAYEATGDEAYLTVARDLWTEIKKSWSDVFDGGITWRTDTPFGKNACSNAPAAILALRLYQVDQNPEDLQWAKDIYNWQKATLVDPATGLVWDNISMQNGEVVINKDWIFTYNLGTYIGAANLLYEITGEQAYLSDAVQTARSSMTSPKVTSEGLLRSENQGDGGLFKGIFVRYFTDLILQPGLNEATRNELVRFMKFNAETFYSKGIGRPSMLSSPDWRQQPGSNTDLSTQLSGIMLIEAAARLKAEELL